MKKRQLIKSITGLSLLVALEVVLSIVSNFMPGVVNFNLALAPIVIGAVLYGPIGGLILGIINGVITLIAPGTQVFLGFNAFATILLCMLKTGLAGLVAGLIFKYLGKKNFKVSIVLSGLSVPIINTGLFIIGVILFFLPIYGEGQQAVATLFSTVITINFLIEFLISALLSPAIIHIIATINKVNINKSKNSDNTDNKKDIKVKINIEK